MASPSFALGLPRQHLHSLIVNPGHSWKDPVHEEVVDVGLGGDAGIPDQDQVVIQVAAGVSGARDAGVR